MTPGNILIYEITVPAFPRFIFCLLLPLLLSAGCATLPDATATPRLARLTPETMTHPARVVPRLVLDDLLVMASSGAGPDAIVARLRQSGARFDLTPAQILDLHKRGLPLPVLHAIHEDREKALRADLAQSLVEREQQCSSEIAQVRSDVWQRAHSSAASSWPGWHGGCNYLPCRGPAVFMGW